MSSGSQGDQHPSPSLSRYFQSSSSSPFDNLELSLSSGDGSSAPVQVATLNQKPPATMSENNQPPHESSLGTKPQEEVPQPHAPPTVPQSLPTSGAASADKLKQYFSAQTNKSPFDALSGIASIDSLGKESAMMNPAYISPTEAFGISTSIPSPESFLTPATEQDVFTASLLSSDADRRHDAWIPSESTRKALQAMEANPPGIYFPEKELLTMPGIAIKEDFVSDDQMALPELIAFCTCYHMIYFILTHSWLIVPLIFARETPSRPYCELTLAKNLPLSARC